MMITEAEKHIAWHTIAFFLGFFSSSLTLPTGLLSDYVQCYFPLSLPVINLLRDIIGSLL